MLLYPYHTMVYQIEEKEEQWFVAIFQIKQTILIFLAPNNTTYRCSYCGVAAYPSLKMIPSET